nr:MAG TPA: hypothetical protein [Bacteriophage sp.]DAF14640.1 MAG TPA: hypothetical protein [Crassvirales sp.]DAJ12736.1 MAG TPA: hypothetical protein [Bacteriophage sp.]DAN94718.1 MAG TPA: hypothetical protein [Bacteriophage sp.]DAO30045.1 MAG TPA: hypothetical protein [Bacteriophage sp.]
MSSRRSLSAFCNIVFYVSTESIISFALVFIVSSSYIKSF